MPFGDKSKAKDPADQRYDHSTHISDNIDRDFMPVRQLSEGPDDFPDDLINVDGDEEIVENAIDESVSQDQEASDTQLVARAEKKGSALKVEGEKECALCHVKATSTWRRDEQGQLICNKCGLRKRKDNKPKKPRAPKAQTDATLTSPSIGKENDALSIFGAQNGSARDLNGEPSTGELSDTVITPIKPPRKPRKSLNPSGTPKSCFLCGVEQSPAWRKDDEGHSLCNRCMLRKKRAIESSETGRKYTPRAKPIIPVQRDTSSPSSIQIAQPAIVPIPTPSHDTGHGTNIPIDPQLMQALEADIEQSNKRQKLEESLARDGPTATQNLPNNTQTDTNQPLDDLSQFQIPSETPNTDAPPFRPVMPNFT